MRDGTIRTNARHASALKAPTCPFWRSRDRQGMSSRLQECIERMRKHSIRNGDRQMDQLTVKVSETPWTRDDRVAVRVRQVADPQGLPVDEGYIYRLPPQLRRCQTARCRSGILRGRGVLAERTGDVSSRPRPARRAVRRRGHPDVSEAVTPATGRRPTPEGNPPLLGGGSACEVLSTDEAWTHDGG